MSRQSGNRPGRTGLILGNLIHGVPMAVITYGTDIAPHLQRAMMYRRRRMRRWEVLHPRHDCDDYDPYAWARASSIMDILVGLTAAAFFAVADRMGLAR